MYHSGVIDPHGGVLINLLVDCERAVQLRSASRAWPSWDLSPRQLCDLELLLNGGFSPLRSFMTRADYESVGLATQSEVEELRGTVGELRKAVAGLIESAEL